MHKLRKTKFFTWVSKPSYLHWIALASSAPVVVIALILEKTRTVPYYDQWFTSFDIATATVEGRVTLDMLLAQHNEHRIFFTNVLTVLSTVFTRWDVRFEQAICFAIAVANMLLVTRILYVQRMSAFPVALVPLSALIFSVRQSENWLFGFQSCWFFVTMFVLLSISLGLQGERSWRRLAPAALFATCATFSLGAGLLSWFALLVGMWLYGYRDWRKYAFWLVSGGVVIALYSVNLTLDAGSTPENPLPFTILNILHYSATYMSSLFISDWSPPLWQSLIIFGIGLAVFWIASFYVWRRIGLQTLAPWWSLATFSLGSALLVGVRRVEFGIVAAMGPRYVTLSSLFWISTVALAILVISHVEKDAISRTWRRLLTVSFTLVGAVYAGLYVRGNIFIYDSLSGVDFQQEAQCVRLYPIIQNTDCLENLLPDQYLPMLTERIAALDRNQLTIFADRSPLIIDLSLVPVLIDDHASMAIFRPVEMNGFQKIALFQQVDSTIVQAIHVPADVQTAVFQSAAFFDQRGTTEDVDMPLGGIEFQVDILGKGGKILAQFKHAVDPFNVVEPIPFSLVLTDIDEDTLALQFTVRATENLSEDRALWVQPTLELVRH